MSYLYLYTEHNAFQVNMFWYSVIFSEQCFQDKTITHETTRSIPFRGQLLNVWFSPTQHYWRKKHKNTG